MNKPEFNILHAERCSNLRWKGLFIDPETADVSTSEHLWCVKTQLAFGPDGKVVDKYECNPARPCYRAI